MNNNISNFFNTNDYLPILNASIIAELIVLLIVYYTPFFNSKYLMKWYETYRLSAVLADVLILMIGLILARYVFHLFNLSWNFLSFLIVVLTIQIIHDILFYIFFTFLPRGTNKMLDLFKDYAREVGAGAVFGDSFMISITVLLSAYLANATPNTNILILIFSLYLLPYILYTN